ncbi:WD40/YVTN/BNR-like repeat-containing protein [Archangium sp.]|uniref:WD40/YVTN/BNR-like repeat-containing protein n=1 Tax=Archangium sp. TaxID=1872627 RepID=UPI003899BD37
MRSQKNWHRMFAAALAVTLAPVYAAHAERDHDADDATARRQAMDQWYNETYSQKAASPRAKGGPWTPAFQRFMNDAAAKERAKYASQLPGTATTITAVTNPNATIAATGSTWVNIGPTKADYIENGSSKLVKTDAGRVNTIVVDPTNTSVIYTAFSGGGLWKTTNGGTTWTPLTESLGSLSVGTVALDPNNSQTVYLGLGDPFDGTGIGLVKSTDGGATWMAPVYLGDSTSITDIKVATTNSNIVLATTNKGIFRSVDAGASWTKTTQATGFTEAPAAWSLAQTGPTRFVATLEAEPSFTSGNTQGQIWVSNDSGATWTRATGATVSGTASLERMTLAAAPSNPSIVYAEAGNHAGDLQEIYKSTDGGSTWVALSAAGKRYSNRNTEASTLGQLLNTQGWYNQAVVVSPTDPNTVYFGGALHMAKTSDGGSTFKQISNWLAQFSLPYVHADFHAATMAGGKLYVGTDGGMFVSADAGTTFSDSLNVGIASHLIYDVGSSGGDRNAVIVGLQDNGTRVRSAASSVFNQEIGGDGFGCAIHPTNAKLMLGSLYYDRIQKSTDGGLTWAASATGITESNNSSTAPFTTVLARWTGDTTGNTVFTFSNTKVYKSTNFGTSWTALGITGIPSGIFIRGVGAAHSNGSVLGFVASGGRVMLSNNGGTSWTLATTTPNNGLSMSSVAFDPTNPNTVYVTSVAPDATKSHAWKSTDFGVSWTAIENGLPAGVPVNQISIDPGSSTTLYAATHLGVYRSTDAGASWTRFGTGMPLVNVTDIEILPDSSLVRAATFGRSVWELTP